MNASATFDISDPFDAAVFWHTFLTCQSCDEVHDIIDDPGEIGVAASLPSYHATGQTAKESGWYICDLHQWAATWEILCPRCVAQRGRSLSDRGTGAVSSMMVRELYITLTGRTD